MADRKSMFDDLSFIKQRAGCQACGRMVPTTRSRRGCAYAYPDIALAEYPEAKEGDENDPNYARLCPECWVEDDEYWEGMWAEYYSSRL